MNDDTGFSKSSILVSFVAGGLAGAAVAILLAPQSGQGTRRLINRQIKDGVDRGRKASEGIASKGREVLEGASSYLGKAQKDEQRHDRVGSVEACRQREDRLAF